MTSLVTRCPQCRAAFRVVAEQLHLRNGKVRCGVCNAVFDARAHQEPVPEPIVPQAPAAPASPTVVAEPPTRVDSPKRNDPPVVDRHGVATPSVPPAVVRQPPAVTLPAAPASQRQTSPDDSPVTPDDSPIRHVEPWLSEDAVASPVSAQAGRLREPVMGAASQPAAGATNKREPVFKAGAMPPPVQTGLPERRDPQLHEQGSEHHANGDFGSDGFGDDDGFDGIEREPQEHHRPKAQHDPDRDHERIDARHFSDRTFSARPLTTPSPGVRPVAVRPGATRPGSARPFVTQPSTPQAPASRSSSSASSTPPFVARPLSAPLDDARTHREPVMGSRSHVAHEPVHDANDFVAHGPRSGYAVDLRGARRGGLARVFWSVCCILAGLALVLQALWWWRTPIATYVPAMRPVYEAVCAGLDCRVGYVRIPALLSIESSSIQPQALSQPSDKAQHMTLSAVLRNRASHAQPWPAIELTLTDFANVVVARRMLLPAEYLGSGAPASFSSNAEREIAVALAVRGAPVSGYRLALFFP